MPPRSKSCPSHAQGRLGFSKHSMEKPRAADRGVGGFGSGSSGPSSAQESSASAVVVSSGSPAVWAEICGFGFW